ncbi:MAG: hypothetical protein Q9160_003767 [Pyrenula sp. 1 TL-2023]
MTRISPSVTTIASRTVQTAVVQIQKENAKREIILDVRDLISSILQLTWDFADSPCKQPTCPSDDKVPKCSADNCQGKDNKCTKDPLKTCLCCPDAPLLCSDCKGSQNKCQSDTSKGCQCKGEIDSATSNSYWMVAGAANVLTDWSMDIFKTQYGGDIAKVPFGEYLGQPPALSDISCSGPSNQAWDPATVKNLVKQFCQGFDPNKDKKQSFSDDVTGFCASKIDIEFKKGRTGSCSKSCEDTFGDMITRCKSATIQSTF